MAFLLMIKVQKTGEKNSQEKKNFRLKKKTVNKPHTSCAQFVH